MTKTLNKLGIKKHVLSKAIYDKPTANIRNSKKLNDQEEDKDAHAYHFDPT